MIGPSAPQIPEEIQVDPIKGWKWAGIRAKKDGDARQIYLSGPMYNTQLKVEAKAECRREPWAYEAGSGVKGQHSAPDLKCRCGFYALKIPVAAYTYESEVLLQVELYGKIIEYERGYRAEYQRILGGWIYRAGKCMCGHQPSRVGIHQDGSLNTACPDCVSKFTEQWSMSDLSQKIGIQLQYGWPEHAGVTAPSMWR